MTLTADRWKQNRRLQQASDDKPAMRRGEPNREAVKLLQQALIDCGFPIADGATGNYLSETAAAVRAVEQKFNLSRDDGVAGREVLSALDALLGATPPNPAPPAPPAPTPPPTAGVAEVQIGPLGPGQSVVESFYRHCARETIASGRLVTSGLRTYTTFEGLLDLLLTRSMPQQVIVNHGDDLRGLLIPWCRETSGNRDTLANIGTLAKVAAAIEQGTDNDGNNDFTDALATLKFMIDMSRPVALRLARKLVGVRKKQLTLHIRACHISQQGAQTYKDAFKAQQITFHSVRLLFMEIKPAKFKPGHSAKDFPFSNNTQLDRARVFEDPFGELATLVIAILDRRRVLVHGQVVLRHERDFSFMDRIVPSEIHEWAETIIGAWTGPPDRFVLPAMWDANERSFACPFEDDWRLTKLQSV